jgi:hypothetical protein
MTAVTILALIRMLGYGIVAFFALHQRRWIVWLTFTALVFSTYAYSFSGLSAIAVEIIRTLVGVLLIYITLRRK